MAPNVRQIFVKNLKYYMERKRVNQVDLSNALEVSTATASDWYNGKKYPRVDKMQRMADYLGCRMEDLTIGRDGA